MAEINDELALFLKTFKILSEKELDILKYEDEEGYVRYISDLELYFKLLRDTEEGVEVIVKETDDQVFAEINPPNPVETAQETLQAQADIEQAVEELTEEYAALDNTDEVINDLPAIVRSVSFKTVPIDNVIFTMKRDEILGPVARVLRRFMSRGNMHSIRFSNPRRQKSTITFSTALITSNSFVCFVESVLGKERIAPTVYATSHAATMATIAERLVALPIIESIKVDGNIIHLWGEQKAGVETGFKIKSAAVTLGETQPTTTIATSQRPSKGDSTASSTGLGTSIVVTDKTADDTVNKTLRENAFKTKYNR